MTRGKLRSFGAATLLAVLLLFVSRARGDDAAGGDSITYTVKAGDTLELLAAEYYGDRNHQIFIMVANGLEHARPLTAGERLKIPASREVTVDVNDSFDSLAEAYLGDRRRGKFLAAFNGLGADESPAAGTTLAIPFQIVHTAAGEEGLDAIAAAYFGDSKNAELLREYNFLDDATLAAGESIVVPIHHVRIRSSKLPPADKASQERSEKRKRIQDEARRVLPEARTAWRQGEHGSIKSKLIPIQDDRYFLDARLAADVGVLLGCAYVATGDPESARETFKAVLARRPNHVLDAYTYSPKIRDVWKAAGGKTDE